jgi:hypothetical protein
MVEAYLVKKWVSVRRASLAKLVYGAYIHLSIYLSIYLTMDLQSFIEPWPLFSFLILYTVGRTLWSGDQPVARPLPIHRTTRTQNKSTQISMPQGGFEPTIPVFERRRQFMPQTAWPLLLGMHTFELLLNSDFILTEVAQIIGAPHLLMWTLHTKYNRNPKN